MQHHKDERKNQGFDTGDLKKLKKVQTDVNFIKNMHLDEMPEGFGTFQSGVEIDTLYARMDVAGAMLGSGHQVQQDQDLKKIQKREDEQDLMASRVIQKFNNNSERILNLLANKKKASDPKEFIYDTMDRKDRLHQEQAEQKSLANTLIVNSNNAEQLYLNQTIASN